MCIIMVGEVTRAQHNMALKQNGDGFSLFTAEQGLIKSPSEYQIRKALGKFGIWHYRIATSGTKDVWNIHPFRVCHSKCLLYHNGVLGEGKDTLSDTHALAEMLQDVSIGTAKSVLASLTDSGRFLLADANDPHKFVVYGKWVADAGVLMSHRLVQPSYTTQYTSGAYTRYKGYGAIGASRLSEEE